MTKASDVHAINCTGKIDNISIVLGGYGPEHAGSYESKLIQFGKLGVLKPTTATRNGFTRNYKLSEGMFGSSAGPGWLKRGLPVKTWVQN